MRDTTPDAIELKSVTEWRQEIWDSIAERGTLRKYRRHELLFGPDAASTMVYSVKKGLVEIAILSRAGRELTESIRGPGDTFGYAEIILRETRHRQATVLQDAEIWCLERARFLAMLSTRPEIVLAMFGSALHRVSRMHEMRANMRGSSAQFRVGYVLSRLANAEPDRERSNGPVLVRISHEEIGRMCGLSRQTVTTELGILRATNIVRLGSRSIEVIDLDALERFLEDLSDSPGDTES